MRSEIEHNEERRMQVEHHKSSRKTIPFPDQHEIHSPEEYQIEKETSDYRTTN